MAMKNLTENCRECELFKADGPHGICTWGNSNMPKYLQPPKDHWRKCKLIKS